MDYQFTGCIDSGSENCPCYLAVTGDCLVCSRLQGKDCCDCRWNGVCIYNEFIQNGRRVNNPRKDFKAGIVEKQYYGDDLIVFVLEVGKGFALKASRPGSYVFLKAEGMEDYFQTPISVLNTEVELGRIYLAVKVLSGKTKQLAGCEGYLIVRGVYRNGILGIKKVIGSRGRIDDRKKTLIITKGVGFAPGALLAAWAAPKARVDFLVDPDKAGEEFVRDYLPKELTGTVRHVDLAALLGGGEAAAEDFELADFVEQGGYDLIVVLTSDYYIGVIGQCLSVRREAGGRVPEVTACANNFHLCCGEGICGACTRVDENGTVFKMCKCAD